MRLGIEFLDRRRYRNAYYYYYYCNQVTDGFIFSTRDLVMRFIALSKGASPSTWFQFKCKFKDYVLETVIVNICIYNIALCLYFCMYF